MIKHIICKMKKKKYITYKINKKDSNSFLNTEHRISVRVSTCIILSFG